MIYEIAICDDEVKICNLLERIVLEWAKDRNKRVNISKFSSSESFLFEYEEDKQYHILLLDIEMPGINGVELAERIRKYDKGIQIVFVTGYMDYIAKGYDVDALNYLLKPVREEKLYEVLDKAVERIETVEQSIYVETSGGMVKIDLHNIIYAEVDRNYVTVHTLDEKYRFKQTLKGLEEEVDERFFRAHRSYLVNLKHIKKIKRTDIELTTGDIIPLARDRYEGINNAIIEYF